MDTWVSVCPSFCHDLRNCRQKTAILNSSSLFVVGHKSCLNGLEPTENEKRQDKSYSNNYLSLSGTVTSLYHEMTEITKKQLTNQKHLCIIIKVWLGENYVD